MTGNAGPKLRTVQASVGQWRGQHVIVLQDPLGLSGMVVAVPRELAMILELCDGTRDVSTLKAALELRTGLNISSDHLTGLLAELDDALLLENERFEGAYREAVREFREAPCRPPVLAGKVYPADADMLDSVLREYLDSLPPSPAGTFEDNTIHGLVSPHIDYQRGAHIYAEVWRRAAAAARSADVVVIMGTNHFDSRNLFTLTRQSYSTPWGVLPTSRSVVDQVASELGEDVFSDEIHHRAEHSVEISAVWLHYLVRQSACELVPVLCGSFERFVYGDNTPGNDGEIARFVDAMRNATAGCSTLIVASADLAHVGPAFGDNHPVDRAKKAKHAAADAELTAFIAKGDAEGMFSMVKNEGDQRRICGLAPIYLALRLLGKTEGEVTGYDQCPADREGTSFVSICGVLLS